MKVEFLQENAGHIAVLSDAMCLFTNCVLGAEHYLGNGPRGYDCLGFLFFLIYHAKGLNIFMLLQTRTADAVGARASVLSASLSAWH